MADGCPTCVLLQALLETAGVEVDTARKVSRSKPVKSIDKKAKRKVSAYQKRYGAAFKRLAKKYKTKSGKWKKDGFKRCAAAARKEAKK